MGKLDSEHSLVFCTHASTTLSIPFLWGRVLVAHTGPSAYAGHHCDPPTVYPQVLVWIAFFRTMYTNSDSAHKLEHSTHCDILIQFLSI